MDGCPLKSADLIKLHLHKNDAGEYVDPVTYKVLTDNTHIVALRNTGNAFSWDTVERLNVKAKHWKDLLTDETFKRSDIIVLQDPQNIESRNFSQFKYLKDGSKPAGASKGKASQDVSGSEGGSVAISKVSKAKEAVARARAERSKLSAENATVATRASGNAQRYQAEAPKFVKPVKPLPYNAAQYTTGRAAASFTSTGLTPNTSTERATLTDEEYMLKPRRVKLKGYIRLSTNLGDLNIELYPEHAPKAVWNFLQLTKKGYYQGVSFHRNIKNFMIQGGDPTGTGKGGQSCWAPKYFEDELDGPLVHDGRGVLSMANKGKDTNTSQFFLTYRAVPHLNRKHTVFGRVIEGADTTLKRLESVPVDDKDRPTESCEIDDIHILIDPFEDFLKQRSQQEADEAKQEEIRRKGGTGDDRTTWTGKKIASHGQAQGANEGGVGVGEYLKQAQQRGQVEEDGFVGEWDAPEPPAKKMKTRGGFGNFDSW